MTTTFVVLVVLSATAATYIDYSSQTVRESVRATQELQTTHLSESGVQAVVLSVWRPFKQAQNFETMDATLAAASGENPLGSITASLDSVGDYAAGIVGYTQPAGDSYTRILTIRSVGFIDQDNDNVLDATEPRKLIDVQIRFGLDRSPVFDYTYFTNNHGWMYGFNETNLIINGDVRANGDFEFQGGSPVLNGSIYASMNNKLSPAAPGLINSAPVKWTNSDYAAEAANNRYWRQAYDPAKHGAIGSYEWSKWKDLVFQDSASMVSGKSFGSVLADTNGYRSWSRLNGGQTPTSTVIDANPTSEVIMPDLTDLSYYQNLSQTYLDEKTTLGGAANPYYNQGAFVEVWNSTTNRYQRISTNGVINGSAVLVGTSSRPIRIHGPVTVTEDVVIKGFVEGQGTVYSGRNTHIVGSIQYKKKPDFRGSNFETIESNLERADMLGIAARGSIIMGNPASFGDPYPLRYMTPPFTKGRYDDNGNYVPPFNAFEVDAYGQQRYRSLVPQSTINSISEGIQQIDGIMYTNFVGGGQLGVGGGGLTINGSLISKDEAMVLYSLPMRMNYDNRIKERTANAKPLIDLKLPRSPKNTRYSWQDHGFATGSNVIQIGGKGNANGNTNGNANGNTNGNANGNTNGNANGNTNGNANGNTNGNSNGSSNGSTSGGGPRTAD
jgi:hypothetical protein